MMSQLSEMVLRLEEENLALRTEVAKLRARVPALPTPETPIPGAGGLSASQVMARPCYFCAGVGGGDLVVDRNGKVAHVECVKQRLIERDAATALTRVPATIPAPPPVTDRCEPCKGTGLHEDLDHSLTRCGFCQGSGKAVRA